MIWEPPEKPLSVWTNDTETVAATSAEDALAAVMDSTGTSAEDHEDDEWIEVAPGKVLRIGFDLYDYAAADCPEGADVTIEKAKLNTLGRVAFVTDGRVMVAATAAEWAAKSGRGILCSTEF